MLKHPTEVIPKRKAAQFGADGRPFDPFYYTTKPNYVHALHEASMKIESLKRYEDRMLSEGHKSDDSDQMISFAGSNWLEKRIVEGFFQEPLNEHEYKSLVAILERIAKMPFSLTERDFVFKYRRMLMTVTAEDDDTTTQIYEDESGRKYTETTGRRKEARAKVKMWLDGSGKMRVNGATLLEEFPSIADREQILFPLHFTDQLHQVDCECLVSEGGHSGQAGALRLAISLALRNVVDKTTAEKMRLAGLVTRDPRIVERQKVGQQGARRKYTWKKR